MRLPVRAAASHGPADGRCFFVKPSPGKGLGAFAARSILRGELVVSEAPLLRVQRPFPVDRIRQAVASLQPESSGDFWSLFDKGPQKTAEGIFSCNYFEMHGDGGVYKTICRFNHSCTPNCVHSFRGDTGLGELRAIRSMREGEELTVTYIELLAPKEGRCEELLRGYGFTCGCEACRSGGPESDRRRLSLRELDGRLGEAASVLHALDGEDAAGDVMGQAVVARAEGLRAAVEVLRLCGEEGLASATEVDARACATAVMLLAGHLDHQAWWAAQCLARYGLGSGGAEAEALREQLDELAEQPPKLPPITPSLLQALASVELLL